MCQTSNGSNDRNYTFLGVNKRYLQTYTGLLHAISSVVALIIGNYLYLQRILLGNIDSDDRYDVLTTAFHILSLLSGLSLLPFWDKVQSWQLSTTTMEQKGLSHNQLQNFNRGRGVLATILAAVYPLLNRLLSDEILMDVRFSRVVGVVVATVAYYQYTLTRDYGKPLFIVYGGSKLGYSLHLLLSGRSLYSLKVDYPYATDYLEKEALFVVCCVEFGYLWYYLYSRKLASRDLVQNACKRYHPMFALIFVTRIAMDKWWSNLPLSLSWVMFLNTLLLIVFLIKMVKSQLATVDLSKGDEKELGTAKGNLGVLSRSSSVFDVHNSRTGRRSSIFESLAD